MKAPDALGAAAPLPMRLSEGLGTFVRECGIDRRSAHVLRYSLGRVLRKAYGLRLHPSLNLPLKDASMGNTSRTSTA